MNKSDWEIYRDMVLRECVEGDTPLHSHSEEKEMKTPKCLTTLKITNNDRMDSLIRVLTSEGYILIIERKESYTGAYYLVGVCQEVE